MTTPTARKKPEWLRVRLPAGEEFERVKATIRGAGLHTVCEEARCPNVGECWAEGTATVMILGEVCTRGCRFCAVASARSLPPPDPDEPARTAKALAELGLGYVVLTMVDRDDLTDGGAAHVVETLRVVRAASPTTRLEALVGDFAGSREALRAVVVEGAPDVFAHNVEVVPSLQRAMRDARCSWERSIAVLEAARDEGARVTKSSLMVGCGETEAEVLDALERLAAAGVDVVTVGQYLRPTLRHAEVARFVTPEEFSRYRDAGLAMGLRYVASGPLVRSSYRAAEAFLRGLVDRRPGHGPDAVGGEAFNRYGRAARRLEVVR